MKRLRAALLSSSLCLLASIALASPPDTDKAPGRIMADQATKAKEHWMTTDHSKHDILKQEFTSGPEVTKACLSCHTEAALQFHQTIHWTWKDPHTEDDIQLGKGGLSINNFCMNIQSNEARCTSCHAGYGWRGKDFDFSDQTKVDCLVCHEQTGTYKKFPTGAGHPVTKETFFKESNKTFLPPEWNNVAASVSLPQRSNCGTCHFFGGGGDGVKHGDLDSSLMKPNRELDVHMGTDGQNFTCTRCHSTTSHHIDGRIYATPAADNRKSLIEDDLASRITCESCHSSAPHKSNSKANDHTDKVACQSCHIPTFARVNPTKMWWDWSKAGQLKNGKPYHEEGTFGKPVYNSKKGEMTWEKNVTPEYFWYNGSLNHLTVKDTIDPEDIIALNAPVGDRNDKNARIFPFKVHLAMQPYDKVNKNIVISHLFPKGKDDKDAYWKTFNWEKAIEYGMRYADLPYSGEFDFVKTSYVYPITHMVAPKDHVVQCRECHQKDGRLANLAGFYMPGRDHSRVINTLGWFAVFASLIGVLIHALGRIFTSGNSKED